MKIKNFDEYENMLFEYRTPGAKNKSKMLGPNTEVIDPKEPQPESEKIATVGKDVVKLDNYKDFEGKPASKTPARDRYSIDAPVPEDKKYLTDIKHWSDHIEDVFQCMRAKTPFFVQGEAGWGKTAVITNLAKKCGYYVITLYLDKMLPEDLGGLNAIKEDKDGEIFQVNPFPTWAQYIWDHKDKQFLLFLDEMNQASNAVMNALMPIVKENVVCGVKFDNFFCGGAGNMSFENDLEEIPIPLMSRMGGAPVAWLAGTPEAWTEAFSYLHKEWDNKLGKKLVDSFEQNAMIFASPRDVENNIFKRVYRFKESFSEGDEFDEMSRVSVESFARTIKRQTLTVEGRQRNMGDGNKYSPEIRKKVEKLAQLCYDFINDSNKKRKFNDDNEQPGDSTQFNEDAIDKDQLDKIINAIVQGTNPDIVFEDQPDMRVPVTRETVYDIFPGMSKTFLDSIEAEMKKRKVEWKYPSYTDAVNDKSRNDWKTYDWTASMFED